MNLKGALISINVLLLFITFASPGIAAAPKVVWTGGISVVPVVPAHGSNAKISATFKVLQDITGLRIIGGVDSSTLYNRTFTGLLAKNKVVTIHFNWNAVKGNHTAFFQLIPPRILTKRGKKITKQFYVSPVKLKTHPGTNTRLGIQSKTVPKDLCEGFEHLAQNVVLESFSIRAAYPNNRNSEAIIDVKVRNKGNRCVKLLFWSLYSTGSDYRKLAMGQIKPEDYGKTKWLLKGGEKMSFVITLKGVLIFSNVTPLDPSACLPPFTHCYRVRLQMRTETSQLTNLLEAIIGWSFSL